jgi:hypothetical protein
VLALLVIGVVGCASFIDGVTDDTAPDVIEETTPTEMPAEDQEEGEDREVVDPFAEVTRELVSATLDLRAAAGQAGISDNAGWDGAMTRWTFGVEAWLRDADGNLFAYPGRGTEWTQANRLRMLMDLSGRITSMRADLRLLAEIFNGIELTPEVVVECMPDVEIALDRAGRAITAAEFALSELRGRLGVR